MYKLYTGFQHGKDPIEWNEIDSISAPSRRQAVKLFKAMTFHKEMWAEKMGEWKVRRA